MSFAKCTIYLTNIYVVRKEESLPTRERGLKLDASIYLGYNLSVAPHAGAWIETKSLLSLCSRSYVAPHAGAWIETIYV